MGHVYRARQKRVDRIVALKVLPQSLARDEGFAARFEREARAASAVSHPNITAIIEVGEDQGWRFLAMEFVDGASLLTLILRARRLDEARALGLMKQVVAALIAAHEAGIVHRDIKPANILIDASGTAKVADFGLAKRPGTDVSLTTSGIVLGTPLYMAPELARGKPLDARADLYSLGATFYHALAGHPPFEADTATELVLKHATEPPAPLASQAPGVGRRFAQIIDRLLSKEPEFRHPSARALFEELEALARPGTPPPAPGLIVDIEEVARPAQRAAPRPVPTAPPTRRTIANQTTAEARPRAPASAPAPVRTDAAEGAVRHVAARRRRGNHMAFIVCALALLAALIVALAWRGDATKSTPPAEEQSSEKTQEPEGKTTAKPVAPVIRLKAARATIHDVQFAERDTQNGCIRQWRSRKEWLSWACDVPAAGTYQVEVCFACGPESAGTRYVVRIGRRSVSGQVRSTGSWNTFETDTLGTVTLDQAGPCRLSVKPLEQPAVAVMSLRSVLLRPIQP